MSALVSFHSRLMSIMDTLAKTAAFEIGQLVDLEMCRSRAEVAALRSKLRLMETLLWNVGGPSRHVCGEAPRDRDRDVVKREAARGRQWDGLDAPPVRDEGFPGSHDEECVGQPQQVLVKEEPCDEEPLSEIRAGRSIGVDGGIGTLERGKTASGGLQDAPRPSSAFGSSAETFSFTHPEKQEVKVSPNPIMPNQEKKATPVSASPPQALQRLNLAKNLRGHSAAAFASDKRFPCTHCGKRFRCFSQLEIHQRSHTGEKPFRCTLCGKRYAQKGHLYTHQRTHTGEKPYRCLVCGKGFIQKCTLDMHHRTHTGEKPFLCVRCGKGFTKKCNLKKHLSVHADVSSGARSPPDAPGHRRDRLAAAL
ncbi:zinc finger protein 629 [Denticeps clupeoides]|uniref:zinc finger protein 629 n=1 Tax=Denticeps clupeoides TaxID=299321 RepID=UPI0010A47164|nr:zinc finger protein 629-like [Denticeps clupeoides]